MKTLKKRGLYTLHDVEQMKYSALYNEKTMKKRKKAYGMHIHCTVQTSKGGGCTV